jgi:hypothetical protein
LKYFTPELFVRLQDQTDEQSFLASYKAWEQAVEAYAAQLKEIAPFFRYGVRRLANLESLHDARVLNVWHARTRLTIVLRRETADAALLVLEYSLVDTPYINVSALPEQYRSADASWLYDEIDIERDTIFDTAARIQYKSAALPADDGGQDRVAPVFRHGILLSNGWELQLRFHGARLSRPSGLIPAVAESSAQGDSILQRSA